MITTRTLPVYPAECEGCHARISGSQSQPFLCSNCGSRFYLRHFQDTQKLIEFSRRLGMDRKALHVVVQAEHGNFEWLSALPKREQRKFREERNYQDKLWWLDAWFRHPFPGFRAYYAAKIPLEIEQIEAGWGNA